MKTYLTSLVLLLSLNVALAAEYIDLPSTQFEARAEDIQERVGAIIANPEPILVRYRPVGMKVANRKVSGNTISFMATKSVFGISKTVLFNGTLDINETDSPKNQRCFKAVLDFAGSGALIYENIEELQMSICTVEKAPNHLTAVAKIRLLKGNNYGGVVSGIAKSLIEDQVNPIIASIKEEIEK
jgi:hypothetical protein